MHKITSSQRAIAYLRKIGDCTLGFTRLAINGLAQSGNQPMQDQGMQWVCNGEIYNWTDLRDRHKLNTKSQSDCSVIVRASVGNWMVCKQIKKRSDCKVVFNGDGSDQFFGSYLYFKRAPSQQQFQYQCGRLLTDIHHYDVLRSDRSISSHGLQARTPFLDKQFVSIARGVATEWRLRHESKSNDPCNQKWILRKAFDKTNLLPQQVEKKISFQ